MNKADKKIIEDNPSMSPIGLLDLGLSKKGYDEVVAAEEQPSGLQPQSVVDTDEHTGGNEAYIPKLRSPLANNGQATVLNKKTGRTVQMARRAAEQMAKATPNQFQIVE